MYRAEREFGDVDSWAYYRLLASESASFNISSDYSLTNSLYDQSKCGTICAHLNEMTGACLDGAWLNYQGDFQDDVVWNVVQAINSTFTDFNFAIAPDTSIERDMLTNPNYIAKFVDWGLSKNHYRV